MNVEDSFALMTGSLGILFVHLFWWVEHLFSLRYPCLANICFQESALSLEIYIPRFGHLEKIFPPFSPVKQKQECILQGIENSPGGWNSRGNQSKCSFAYLSFLHFLPLCLLETGKKYWLSVLSTAFYETQAKLISKSITQKMFPARDSSLNPGR